MIENYQITESTPVAMLTVGQQKQLIQDWVREILGTSKPSEPSRESDKRYVYGIAGIATLFQVSYVTAHKLKNGILKPAILQQGRRIMCDAEMAMSLFRQNASNQ